MIYYKRSNRMGGCVLTPASFCNCTIKLKGNLMITYIDYYQLTTSKEGIDSSKYPNLSYFRLHNDLIFY